MKYKHSLNRGISKRFIQSRLVGTQNGELLRDSTLAVVIARFVVCDSDGAELS